MACAGALSAQTDMKGHWSGTIDTGQGTLAIEFDLDKAGDGGRAGSRVYYARPTDLGPVCSNLIFLNEPEC